MLFLLISSLPLLLFLSKSPTLKPLLSWTSDMCLLLLLLWRVFLSLLARWLKGWFGLFRKQGPEKSRNMQGKKKRLASKEESEEASGRVSVLDLPELALDIILGKLPPAGLSNMSKVCKSLRETCRSDHMWEKHMSRKWSKLIGKAARNRWKVYTAPRNESPAGTGKSRARGIMRSISCVRPLCWMKFKALAGGDGSKSVNCYFPDNSIMSWYQALESGKFWFPAQVYNREHGHVGFMMSCYDAEVSYDCRTDTFRARYPPHGRRTVVIEDGVQWERIRKPPLATCAHELYVSDCSYDLKPGDHIEIQWRRNKEFPYGWWYGVVGHLQSCDGSDFRCCCQSSGTLILEFNQYTPGSRWRRAAIDRKNHREEGNETDGFYGGIRKVSDADEIALWKKLWPSEVLE